MLEDLGTELVSEDGIGGSIERRCSHPVEEPCEVGEVGQCVEIRSAYACRQRADEYMTRTRCRIFHIDNIQPTVSGHCSSHVPPPHRTIDTLVSHRYVRR